MFVCVCEGGGGGGGGVREGAISRTVRLGFSKLLENIAEKYSPNEDTLEKTSRGLHDGHI